MLKIHILIKNPFKKSIIKKTTVFLTTGVKIQEYLANFLESISCLQKLRI